MTKPHPLDQSLQIWEAVRELETENENLRLVAAIHKAALARDADLIRDLIFAVEIAFPDDVRREIVRRAEKRLEANDGSVLRRNKENTAWEAVPPWSRHDDR